MATTSRLTSSSNFQVTHRVLDAAKKVVSCPNVSSDLRDVCSELLKQNRTRSVISSKHIRDIYDTLRDAGHKVFLHEIMEDAVFVPQSRELPPRNPELEKRIQKLKIEQENREYIEMTKNVDPQMRGKLKFSFNEEVRALNKQIIAIVNFLVTVAAGFAFGYKGVELAFGKIFPMQMMTGLVLATVVFFVDLYFMLKYGPL